MREEIRYWLGTLMTLLRVMAVMAGAYCLYHVLRGLAATAVVLTGTRDPVLRWFAAAENPPLLFMIGVSAGIGALGGLVAGSKVRGWMAVVPVAAAMVAAGILALLDVMQARWSDFAGYAVVAFVCTVVASLIGRKQHPLHPLPGTIGTCPSTIRLTHTPNAVRPG